MTKRQDYEDCKKLSGCQRVEVGVQDEKGNTEDEIAG